MMIIMYYYIFYFCWDVGAAKKIIITEQQQALNTSLQASKTNRRHYALTLILCMLTNNILKPKRRPRVFDEETRRSHMIDAYKQYQIILPNEIGTNQFQHPHS